MKYHLGCGNKRLENFINIDTQASDAVDVIDDISSLQSVADCSAEVIYACHCLEHFGRNEVKDVLVCWFEKLAFGGTLRLAVPDFNAVVQRYLQNKNMKELYGLLYGGQRNEYDYHKFTFTFESLKEMLEEIGFKNVRRYDWRDTEHSNVDDYSQSYLPHMQKETGILMSLNVEANK